jgi:DNA-binding transcriptional ArsR family regulator
MPRDPAFDVHRPADSWDALASPARRRLLELLCEKDDQTVNELAKAAGLIQPTTSRHLRILREAGLVRARRWGRKQYYHVDPGPLAEITRWASATTVAAETAAARRAAMAEKRRRDFARFVREVDRNQG